MHASQLFRSLERFPGVLTPLVSDLTTKEARWKPADGAWSVLEIVTHLADEEVEDFRARVHMTLDDPAQPWPGIDPEGWARERRYNDGDLREAMDRFLRERGASLAWLNDLDEWDWSVAHEHPKLGPIRAGDVMTSWAAHDLLHLRQITKRLFQMVQRDAGAYRTDYAGGW